uniref:Sodium/hydrogen exchanger n=1 Tax=Plectus sambesii TaxID=2011161 RepID=A0A914X3B0_9BILA
MLGAFAEIKVANLLPVDFAAGFASFFVVALGGVFVGLVWAIITGFTTKHTNHLTVIQPLICLIFPYLAYLLSELVHISGILAIVTCGLVMKQYVKSNVTGKSLVTVNYFLKTLSSSCEAIIFMLLGLSTISEKHYWDTAFVAVTVVACLVFRFIGVFVLCSIVNWRRMAKIDYVDQFIMAYGGLRGAVAYGLVMAIDARVVPAKEMYVTATIAVILFTVFVQGLSIKPMVYWLHVKLEQTEKTKTVTERMFDNMQDHVLVGMEEIIGYRGHHWFKNTFDNMNSRYIEPHVCRTPRTKGAKIMETYETLNVEEALRQLRKDGMPPPESPPPMSVKKSGGMPKVTSLRTLLRETLPPAADIRRYSRHLLDEDVDSTSMNPRKVRQRRLRSIEEEEEMAERTSPLRIRNGRLAPPPIRGPPDSPLPYQGQSVDDSVFDDASDGEFIPISGALRHYPGSDVPVLPVFFVRRDTMSRRTPRSQSERRPARVTKAASIATSDAVDETADNFVTARTSQNTGRVFQRNAKSVDPGEMSSLISQKSNSDVEEDHSSSKDNEEESPL